MTSNALVKYVVVPLIAILVALLLFLPKPVLLSYKAGSSVSKSVYWPGFGTDGRLLDSSADLVKMDEDTQHLHICYHVGNSDTCQQYRIVAQAGLIETLIFMAKG